MQQVVLVYPPRKKNRLKCNVFMLRLLQDVFYYQLSLFGLYCSVTSKQVMGFFIKPAVH